MPSAIALLAACLLNAPATEGLPRLNLHRARPEVEAELVWPLSDAAGRRLTGEGVTICDIDVSLDIFHPMFFKADRGRFAWIDVDGDRQWSPGDAVDIDGDGLPGPEETLAWLPYEGPDLPGRDPSRFQAGYDFLYQDANRNGARDYGPEAFTEEDPCYGEGIFLADDVNGNERLDAGEELIGLKTSKVRAINHLQVYRRGVDLIQYRDPFNEHGTLVCGILAGGWPRRHRLTGIAPDAELLVAVSGGNDRLRWAQAEGANVMLWEYAGEISDGSSELEELVNALSRDGIIFVAAAGNERAPYRHATFSGEAARRLVNRDPARAAVEFVWRGPKPSEVRIGLPGDSTCALALETGFFRTECLSGFRRYLAPGPRGTSSLELTLDSDANVGTWSFAFPGAEGIIHGYASLGQNEGDWIDGDGAFTVTSPGTADSAITVAAYDNDAVGAIAWFSGQGPRLDGYPVVDIAAPGVRVLSAMPGGARFGSFTGTSVAMPFVAGAAALLRQIFPGMDSGQFRRILERGAARDSLTADADRWGAGRLRIYAALAEGLREAADRGSGLPVQVSPNPAGGASEVIWKSTGEEEAELRVFSVTGALVWETRVAPGPGYFRVAWPGIDRRGARVPAGVYFAHVRQGRQTGVERLVRLR